MTSGEPEGILLVDKKAGPTSHDVVYKVKRELDLDKAGHLGTLDPAATGLLVVTINGGTKIAPFVTDEDKEYVGTAVLGIETDTQDADGKVTSQRDASAVTDDDIRRTFATFIGTYSQRPPAFSAVKKGGVPLYKLARAGKIETAPEREVTIRELEILEIANPRVTFRALVSKGTYIRTLAKDVGDKLGCGAHLAALRRTKSGRFDLKDAIPMDELATGPGKRRALGAIIPIADALSDWPRMIVKGEALKRATHGNGLRLIDLGSDDARLSEAKADKAIAVTDEGKLLAIMKLVNARPNPENTEEEIWRPIRVWERS